MSGMVPIGFVRERVSDTENVRQPQGSLSKAIRARPGEPADRNPPKAPRPRPENPPRGV